MTLTPEQNKAICEWAGIKADKASCDAFHCPGDCDTCGDSYPDLNTDRLAVLDLLDVLKEKGLPYKFYTHVEKYWIEIHYGWHHQKGYQYYSGVTGTTKEAAILAAVLQVLEKENI